ncbi:hypothetical protein B0J13DRAFT_541462 [Dactylonectria estremocensis]|uniref:Uncharacterized protein n=1 Tax=Dactylonectria estremocensis TaxID=1079267 RepID=A0A9P9FBC4_9HYPO|nr:hypothetical protein B0J13DRAFT_541462 [Dactylonectria estremocensis]
MKFSQRNDVSASKGYFGSSKSKVASPNRFASKIVAEGGYIPVLKFNRDPELSKISNLKPSKYGVTPSLSNDYPATSNTKEYSSLRTSENFLPHMNEAHQVASLNGISPTLKGNPIEDFMVEYQKGFHIYNDIAKEAEHICHRVFKGRSIPAIISSRAKDPDRLKDKVVEPNKTEHYQSVAAIETDIVDLSGVCGALYFPSHADRAVEIIQSLFQCKNIKDYQRRPKPRRQTNPS